jgi:PKD repeat protein
MRNRLLLFFFIILSFSALSSQLITDPAHALLSRLAGEPDSAIPAVTLVNSSFNEVPFTRRDTLTWESFRSSSQNRSGEAQPLGEAGTQNEVICGGVQYTLLNDGPKEYRYEWHVNNELVSTDYNLVYTFEHNTEYDIVVRGYYHNQVIVSSARFKTSLGPFTVAPQVSYSKPLYCEKSGTYTIYVTDPGPNISTGTQYELWQDGKLLGIQKITDINTVRFDFYATLQENTTYSVRGFRHTGCGDFTSSQDITIQIDPEPNLDLVVELVGGTHCYENREFAFLIRNSEAGFQYHIQGQQKSYEGNGGNLTIPYEYSRVFPYPPGYREELSVFVKRIGCITSKALMQKAVIQVDPLHLDVKTETSLLLLGQSLTLENNSVADYYHWEVVDGDRRDVYTSATLPPITFSSVGDKQVILQGFSNTGCSATTILQFKVIQPFPAKENLVACYDQSIVYKAAEDVFHNKTVMASKIDGKGFVYQTGFIKVGQGSSSSSFLFFVEKHDPSGKLVYHRRSNNTYNNARSFGGSLALDEEGNVYVGGTFSDKSWQIDDVLLENAPFGSYPTSGFILKFDNTGKASWAVVTQQSRGTFYAGSTVTDIVYSKSGHLYASVYTEVNGRLIDADKNETKLESDSDRYLISLVKIDRMGRYLAKEQLFHAGGTGIFPNPFRNMELYSYPPAYAPDGPRLALDADDNILVAGSVSINNSHPEQPAFTIGSTVLTASGSSKKAGYIARYNPAQGWQHAFISYEVSGGEGSTLGSHLGTLSREKIVSAPDGFYTLSNWSGNSAFSPSAVKTHLVIQGQTVHESQHPGSLLLKYSRQGELQWSSFSDATTASDLALRPQGDGVLLYGTTQRTSAFYAGKQSLPHGLAAPDQKSHFLQAVNADGSHAWIWQERAKGEETESQTAVLTEHGNVLISYRAEQGPDAPTITRMRHIALGATCDFTAVTVPFTTAQLCLGETIQLNVEGAVGPYMWEPAAGLSNPTIANPVASPSATTLYTVTTQTAAGETVVREVVVSVSAPFALEPDFTAKGRQGNWVDFEIQFEHPDYSFEWDLGDGRKNSKFKKLTNYYSENGSYTICLTVRNGCDEKTVCKTIDIPCKSPSAEIIRTEAGAEQTFTIGSEENLDSWRWEFSDGFESTERTVTRTLALGQNYSVRLILINDCNSTSKTEYFKTPCPPLNAQIKSTISGRKVVFEAEGVPDAHVEYWQFEGSFTWYTNRTTYTLPANGTYTVQLKLNDGCSSQTISATITIDCEAPSADFTFNASDLTLQFNSLQNISESAEVEWDFGDGRKSEEKNPIHTYTTAGTYSVTLTVTDNCGTASSTKEVRPQQLVTGIIRDEDNLLIKIQPVPANDYLQIEFGQEFFASISHVTVYNALGQAVFSMGNTLQLKSLVDTRELKTGAYHLRVVRKDGHYLIKRFVVQH